MGDLPLVAKLSECPNRLLQRNPGIDGVKLVDVDPVEAKSPQASLTGLAQMIGAAVARPLPGPGRVKPPLVAITRPSG